jgi:hypothetical protein
MFMLKWSLLLEVLLDVEFKLFANSIDVLFFGWDALDPASVVPHHILVKHLADCYNLLVDMVHLEILINTKMDLYLLDCIVPLVQNVLGLEYLAEATFSNDADFLK